MPDHIKVQKPPAEAAEKGGEPLVVAGNLAITPLRDTVLFPGIIQPLTIGRKRSLALVQEVMLGNRVFCVVAQKHADEETLPMPSPGASTSCRSKAKCSACSASRASNSSSSAGSTRSPAPLRTCSTSLSS